MFLKNSFENNLENDFFMKTLRERGIIDKKRGCVNIVIKHNIHLSLSLSLKLHWNSFEKGFFGNEIECSCPHDHQRGFKKSA